MCYILYIHIRNLDVLARRAAMLQHNFIMWRLYFGPFRKGHILRFSTRHFYLRGISVMKRESLLSPLTLCSNTRNEERVMINAFISSKSLTTWQKGRNCNFFVNNEFRGAQRITTTTTSKELHLNWNFR